MLVVASELYGVVEATPDFIKMDGEFLSDSGAQGQILVLNQEKIGSPDACVGYSLDGQPLKNDHLEKRRMEGRAFPDGDGRDGHCRHCRGGFGAGN